jgi:hypothetical protein
MHGDGKRPDDGDDGEVDEDGEIAVQWQNQNVVMEMHWLDRGSERGR